MRKTVKAREHYGAESLNLTIPADTRREYAIEPGDVFEVTVEESKKGRLILKFERVYSAEGRG